MSMVVEDFLLDDLAFPDAASTPNFELTDFQWFGAESVVPGGGFCFTARHWWFWWDGGSALGDFIEGYATSSPSMFGSVRSLPIEGAQIEEAGVGGTVEVDP